MELDKGLTTFVVTMSLMTIIVSVLHVRCQYSCSAYFSLYVLFAVTVLSTLYYAHIQSQTWVEKIKQRHKMAYLVSMIAIIVMIAAFLIAKL